MPGYKLTNAADRDLENIIIYGTEHFGQSEAISFYEGLLGTINNIVAEPSQYPFVFKSKDKFQKAVYKTYAIFFVQRPEHIEIVRVLRRENYQHLLV